MLLKGTQPSSAVSVPGYVLKKSDLRDSHRPFKHANSNACSELMLVLEAVPCFFDSQGTGSQPRKLIWSSANILLVQKRG